MSIDPKRPANVSELLRDAPSNWGRWGPDDEVGALNFLTPAAVLAAVATVRQGKVLTLQMPMADPKGDPVFPGRVPAQRFMVLDRLTTQAADRRFPANCWSTPTTRCSASSRARPNTTPRVTRGTTIRSGTATTP